MTSKNKKVLQHIREEDGTYRYTGDCFRLRTVPEQSRRPSVPFTILLGITGIIVILSGCIDADVSSGPFYVILPFVGEVTALFLMVWNYGKLIASRDRVRAYVLEHVRSRIPGAARVLTLCALLGLILSLIYLMRNGAGGQTAESLLYLGCKAAAALLSLGCLKTFRRLEWEKI